MEKGQLRPPVLVFVQEKDRAKDLFNELIKEKIHVDVIHSERSQLQRDNSVRAFRAGQIWVLICTELMGRGIDFKGVNLVINYDFPTSTVSYIHRIGRTGRGGRQGEAITFFTDKDKTLLRDVASIVKVPFIYYVSTCIAQNLIFISYFFTKTGFGFFDKTKAFLFQDYILTKFSCCSLIFKEESNY